MKLLPCPFCGAQVTRLTDDKHQSPTRDFYCQKCGVSVSWLMKEKEDVEAAWNTRAPQVWQPIDTAPKDGTRVIVPGGIAYWHIKMNCWMTLTAEEWPGRQIQWDVTCWQPLPAPPKPSRNLKGEA